MIKSTSMAFEESGGLIGIRREMMMELTVGPSGNEEQSGDSALDFAGMP